MSHTHNIGGYNAAAEYQGYLDRMNSARLEREREIRKKTALKTFDSEIDPERNGDRDPAGEGDSDGDGEPPKRYA
jgi:hypothetical protein